MKKKPNRKLILPMFALVLSVTVCQTSGWGAKDVYWDELMENGAEAIDLEFFYAAEEHYRKAISQAEKLGIADERVGISCSKLADLYYAQRRYDEAEPLYERARAILGPTLQSPHPILESLIKASTERRRHKPLSTESERKYEQALAEKEELLGKDHIGLVEYLDDLAREYAIEKKYESAEAIYKRALKIRERVLEPIDPSVHRNIHRLAVIYAQLDKREEGLTLLNRSLQTRETLLGPDHPDVYQSLKYLASMSSYGAAELLYKRILENADKSPVPDRAALNDLANCYMMHHKFEEAESVRKKDLEIREKTFGKNHPEVAKSLNDSAPLYVLQGKFDDAEVQYKRALDIDIKTLGANNIEVASCLHKLCLLYEKQKRYDEALTCSKKALDVAEKALGHYHANLATFLQNYASLLRRDDRVEEAAKLDMRAKALLMKGRGELSF